MQRLSNKPLTLTIFVLFTLGIAFLMWTVSQIMWQPTSLSPTETTLVNLNVETPTSEPSEQRETTPTDSHSTEREARSGEKITSMHLDTWRELPLQDERFTKGQFVSEFVEDDTLVAIFFNDESESAIIAVDLTSGEVQQITEFGPQRVLEYSARISSLQFSDHHVIWIEHVLPTNISRDLERSDISQELHIYNLNSGIEKAVPVSGTIFITQMHYKANMIVWKGIIDDVPGIHGYDILDERFFLVEENLDGHFPIFPRMCNEELVIYLLRERGDQLLTTLLVENLISHEVTELGEIHLPQNMSSLITRHTCNGPRIIWIATDTTDRTEYVQVYNFEQRKQHSLQMPDESIIHSIELSGNILSSGLGPLDSVGYDLDEGLFFYAREEREPDSPSWLTRKSEFITGNQWIRVHSSKEVQKIMIADIIRNP